MDNNLASKRQTTWLGPGKDSVKITPAVLNKQPPQLITQAGSKRLTSPDSDFTSPPPPPKRTASIRDKLLHRRDIPIQPHLATLAAQRPVRESLTSEQSDLRTREDVVIEANPWDDFQRRATLEWDAESQSIWYVRGTQGFRGDYVIRRRTDITLDQRSLLGISRSCEQIQELLGIYHYEASYYGVMRYQSLSLNELLESPCINARSGTGLSKCEIALVTYQALSGLKFLHDHGIVHGKVSASALLCSVRDQDLSLKLSVFGEGIGREDAAGLKQRRDVRHYSLVLLEMMDKSLLNSTSENIDERIAFCEEQLLQLRLLAVPLDFRNFWELCYDGGTDYKQLLRHDYLDKRASEDLVLFYHSATKKVTCPFEPYRPGAPPS